MRFCHFNLLVEVKKLYCFYKSTNWAPRKQHLSSCTLWRKISFLLVIRYIINYYYVPLFSFLKNRHIATYCAFQVCITYLESIKGLQIDRSLASCKVMRNFREIIAQTGRKNAHITLHCNVQGRFAVNHALGVMRRTSASSKEKEAKYTSTWIFSYYLLFSRITFV